MVWNPRPVLHIAPTASFPTVLNLSQLLLDRPKACPAAHSQKGPPLLPGVPQILTFYLSISHFQPISNTLIVAP